MSFWKISAKGGSPPKADPPQEHASGEKKTEGEDTNPVRGREGSQRVPLETRPLTGRASASNGTKQIINQVAKQQQSAEKKVVETKQVITFELDREEYAAPILDLREILRVPEIIGVPGVPHFVKGIFNLRGQIVVVVDLEKRFALKREHPVEPRDVIIVEVGNTIFGVVVDEVTGVLQAPVTSIKPTPSLIASKIRADYLNGVIVLEESPGAETPKKSEISTGQEKGELTPEQIEERFPPKADPPQAEKTQKQALRGPGQARILLLLDLPKILSEEELLGFGTTVRQTVEEVT